MKKILISEHSEEAQAFINRLENEYLSGFRSMINTINKLGLSSPSKSDLLDLLNGNFDAMRQQYWKNAESDLQAFRTPAAKEQLRLKIEEDLEEFLKSIPVLFSGQINNTRLSDISFQKSFDLDELGNPFMSDISKETIREGFREYISNPKLLKVHEAQTTLAKDLQNFVDSLVDAKLDKNGFLFAQTWSFVASCFEIEITKDETGIIIESIKIKPRQLNYNKD